MIINNIYLFRGERMRLKKIHPNGIHVFQIVDVDGYDIVLRRNGLTVDYGVKRNNLSHRFRHGFIMHLLHDLKWPAERVKILSRHKSIDGLSRYYNPTDKQIAKNKWEIEKELLDWE